MLNGLLTTLFGRSSPPVFTRERNDYIDALCSQMTNFLTSAGYQIGHGRDYDLYQTDQPYAKSVLPSALFNHFKSTSSPKGKALLECVTRSFDGYVSPSAKIVMLPDEGKLVERFAKPLGLRPGLLREAGLTDQYLYADVLVHEAAHVLGNDLDWSDQSFTYNEFETWLRGHIMLLEAGGYSPTDAVPSLIQAVDCVNTMRGNLHDKRDATTHGWAGAAAYWISQHWDKREEFWDRDNYVFRPEAHDLMQHAGSRLTSEARDRSFSEARRLLDLARAYGSAPILGDAASAAYQHYAESGDHKSYDASMILTRYETSLRVLLPYLEAGSVLRTDANQWLDTRELHIVPDRNGVPASRPGGVLDIVPVR